MKRAIRWAALLFVGATIGAGAATPPPVAVVFSEASFKKSPQGEGRGAKSFLDAVVAALDSAGVEHARLKDSDVAAGRLKPHQMAIFPYSAVWPRDVVAGLKTFIEGGGKAFLFYNVPDEVAGLIGVAQGTWESRVPRPLYATIKLRQDITVPGGLPERVRQGSHNVVPLAPAGHDAEVYGEWLDPSGEPLGIGAVVVSRRGAMMGHVLTSGDVAAKGQMLRGIIGLLAPDIWERAWQRALADAEKVGPLKSFEALAERIERSHVSSSRRRQARARLAEAQELLAEARQTVVEAAPADAEGEPAEIRRFMASLRHADALTRLDGIGRAARAAYALSSPERRDEFRGVWIHTAYGVKDWGWRKSIRHLRDHGFNAIIPNMLWGGLAHYPSEVLPVSPKVEEMGDQIAQCLRWCKRYGVQLHVWKVNFNLSTAPKAFIDKLRAESRLQCDRNGKELQVHGKPWLCPSDTRNFVLERESLLEIVRNYAVDGIHFDYIRYPGSHGCFCPGCRERFEKSVKTKVAKWPADLFREPLKPLFAKWRQDQISRLVAAVSIEARRIRPGVMISAAVFGDWASARTSVGQDWRGWVEAGYLDFVCPMDYTTSADRLAALVGKQVGWVQGGCPIYAGVGAWRIPDAPSLLHQLETARHVGADGFVCFHYNDLDFAGDRMPALSLSHTASRARPPHQAPQVRFVLPPGVPELTGLGYPAGADLEFRVTPYRESNLARRPRAVRGRVTLETTDGREVRRFGRVREREELVVQAKLPAGRYRLVVRGKASTGWFSGQSFVTRSRPFQVVGEAKVAEEVERQQPPKFRTAGLRVGVVSGGYGSEGILMALRRMPGIEALPVQKVAPDYVRPCQVVILPQPRASRATTAEAVEALRAFVAAGGGLLATHDAAGHRTHPVPIPEVCPGGRARVEGTAWWAVTPHPVTQGLPVGKRLEHSYYDFIALRVGAQGRTVIEGIRGARGSGPLTSPAVVCGEFERGRYVACGLALGIDKQDVERAVDGAELGLLVNSIRWLARQ